MTPAWPLYGHSAAEKSFLDARAEGRLHHAWLLEGPSGIGKAQLAKRMAAVVLGAAGPDAPKSDPVVSKMLSRGHPDLKWIWREPDEKGKIKQDIPVDKVRELNQFFSLKSALSGWRVGVIDSIDELNLSGANAMLKTLEEPPKNCLLILINHGDRVVLPTIRSRCRRLKMGPLSAEDTLQVLGANDMSPDVADLAPGRPGLAMKFATPEGMKAAHLARAAFGQSGRQGANAKSAAIRAAGQSDIALQAASLALLQNVAKQAETDASYADIWLSMTAILREAQTLNLQNVQTAAKLFALLP